MPIHICALLIQYVNAAKAVAGLFHLSQTIALKLVNTEMSWWVSCQYTSCSSVTTRWRLILQALSTSTWTALVHSIKYIISPDTTSPPNFITLWYSQEHLGQLLPVNFQTILLSCQGQSRWQCNLGKPLLVCPAQLYLWLRGKGADNYHCSWPPPSTTSVSTQAYHTIPGWQENNYRVWTSPQSSGLPLRW